MSKFCIELDGMMLPDAIAAVVEAWYEAQCINDAQTQITIPRVARLSDWIEASGLSRSTAYELLKLLQIEPEARRVPTSRKPVSHLSADQVQLLQPWADKIQRGSTLPQIRELVNQPPLTPMADLASRWGITANTVSRRLSLLGIKPIRQGNYRFITAEQLALGDELQQHVLSGKPMELFISKHHYAAGIG